MSRCMLLFPNRADKPRGALPGAVITGPTWALPLENMQDRESFRVARSVDTKPANTQFDVKLNGGGSVSWRALIACGHNWTVTSFYRVTYWWDDQSYDEPAGQITKDAFASVAFTEDLPYEAENWWDGKPLTEEISGFTQNAILILPEAATLAPNIRVEIFDEQNPDGYVQITRLFVADGWQPSHNYAYGGSQRYEDQTQIDQSLSGAEFFEEREPYRVATIAFEYLPEDEALLKGLDIARRAGVHGELFWISDPENERTLVQTSFLGRLQQLPDWARAVFQLANIAYQIKETR